MTDDLPPRPTDALLYVDDSGHWHQAARLLAQYVRQSGGTVTVLAVGLLASTRARALDEAKRILGLPNAQVRVLGRAGLVERVLPDVAAESDVGVVIVGRLGSVDRLTSGLIAYLIVKRTPASVLVVRGKPETVRSVLVCTEGARHGRANFDQAARIARAFSARLTILHVLSQMSLTDEGVSPADETAAEFIASDDPVAQHLRDLDAARHGYGLEGGVEVRRGLVVDEVIDALRAGNHDLLVIGAHAAEGREGLLYEDIASLIVRSSPVSTLVVRDRKRGAV